MNTLSMARKKKDKSPNQQLAQAIIDQYQPQSVEDMQNALKDIFGPMFEALLQGEMNSHLGYSNNERGEKETANRRNGYIKKTLKTTVGDVPIEVPRDREGTFEPVVVPKRKRDVSAIQDKVLSMYAKGMSQRDIVLSSKLNDALSGRLFYADFGSHGGNSHFKNGCFCELFS